MKVRVLPVMAALTLAISFGIGSGSGQAAYAQGTQNQYCNGGYCLNGWNGGPEVNAYTVNHVNNNFSVFRDPGTAYDFIEYTGDGNYKDQCIGDYGDSSSDARAGLSGFCSSGQIAWGAIFKLKACGNGDSGWAFKNVHWGGWLTPNSHSDGSPFYLNSATETCYQVSGAG